MIKAKKLVALMLAFLMIFSSASVLATAMSDTVDAGTALNITTKFFKEVDGTWVETTKVEANDTVKARVYLDTDYYAADSTLLFFYDKDFFTHSYAGQHNLEMNGDAASFAAVNGITGSFVTNANLESQVDYGYISADQLNDYGVFAANIAIKDGNTVMFDGSDWLFEFTLTVAADAAGEGDLFTVEELYQNTTRTEAYGDVPKSEQGGVGTGAWPMWSWDAAFTFESQPVTTISSITFNANGGAFADGNDTFGPVEGTINTTIADGVLPADPTYAGYTFLGWVDAEIADPTESDIVAAPATYPEDDLVLNAYWVKNVNITFADTGDTTIDPITNVTPNTAFKDIINPTKAGYTFVGWNVRGGELPEVYPSVDTTYTAIWATNVEVSFETNGADAIAPVKGYEGAPFEATIDDPEKEGHYFVGWILQGGDGKLVDLPTVFPATDVTYEAIFDTYTYYVMYYVKNVKTGETTPYFLQAEYGAEIGFPKVNVPEGYAMDSQWYTDPDCTVPFVAGTTMGTAPVSLYTTIDIEPYKAYFLLEQGDDLADAYAVVDAEYLEPITAPAPPTKEGYEFAGWTPYVGILDKEEDVVFYATWNEKVHNVTYYLNDDTATVYEAYDVPFNGDLEVPAAPVREGYTFIGWNTDETATEAIEIVGTKMPDGDVAYYAIWEVNEYTVTFDSNEGTAVEDKTQAYKSSVTAPAEPTREGYKFVAWKDADDKAVTFPFEMPAHDVALKAEWKLESYTLTFAETGDTTIIDKVVKYGDTIEAVEDPVKAGYKFLAWSPEVPTEIGDLGNDGDTITYTAQWKQEEYTLKFVDTGDEVIADKVVKMGDTISVPAELTKDGLGYYFTGWDKPVPTAIVDMGNDGDEFTYTALWDKESYTLKFADTNDAGDVITEVVTFGDSFAAPTGLTKTGYVFDGWDVTPPTTIEDMGNNGAEITYTAQWAKETYIFHFTNTGDTTVADATVTYGDTYKAPEGLTKTGYNHTGWDPVVPATITDLGEDKQEFTFAATWTPKTIDVTFDGNNGLVDGAATKVVPTEFDSDIVAPAAARDGYAFVGWSTDKDATVGTTELGKLTTETPATYYAIWSASSANYTVEFYYMNVDGTDYVLADDETKTLAGVVDQAVPTYVPDEVTGFTFNAGMSTVDGTVPATGTLTLKVYYDRDKFTVTYEGNEPVEVYFGAEIPAAEKEPTKEGNYFVKWNNALTEMPADDLVIAAEWATESYKLTFGDLYGNVVDDMIVKYGDKITVPAGLTREGYVFDGWSPELTETIGDLGDNGDTVTYTAKWSLDQFTITIKLDGGNIDSDIADVVITKDYGAAVEFDAEPVKEGHTFVDWSVTIPETMPAEDMTITAIWQINTYTITFNEDGGSEVADITAQYGAAITAPAAPTKEGHVFAGWSEELPETMPDYGANGASHEIKATWTAETYVLKFADTGDTTIADKTVTYGDTIEAITGLTKVGHVFAGWDVTPPTEIGDLGANGAEITYTAQWTKETYTLIFADTNDAGDSITMNVTFGDTIEVPADLTKTGHKFAGWDVTPPTEIGDLGADEAVLTYTAQWTKNSYTVTWVDEAGSKEETVVYGDAITAPTAAAKEGYYFVMWTPEVPATMPAENLTFTALYEVSVYNVNYYVDGKFVTGYTAEFGEVIRTENTGYTVPTGYVFDGWYTDAACTTKLAENATVGAQVVNLYAKTTAGTFTANFWLDDAKTELYYTANVVFDKEIRLPDTLEAPTKTGYIFAGWDPYVGLMDEEGKDFVAVWYENDVVTATFYVDGAVYEMFDNLTYGAEMEIPAPPVKAGHRFDGWALKGTTDIVDLQGTTVPAESVEYEAIFTITEFYVTYNNYVASEFGPAGTPAPAYEAYAIDGAEVKNAYNLGDAIVHPAAPVVAVVKDGTTHTEYYTFSHWEDADGNVWADGAAMPANDVALYAKYDRADVYLAVVEGSTGVIEKAKATDMEQWYLYGFTGRSFRESEVPKYFEVKGDGYYEIEMSELSGLFGTGAKLKVYDRLTDELVEEYYIIYFGDINGDGRVNVADSTAFKKELAAPSWSNSRRGVPYRIKAADLNGDKRVNSSDSTLLSSVLSRSKTIDQETGLAS